MIRMEDIRHWKGKDILDTRGEKVGTVKDFYLSKDNYDPEWVIVKRNFLGVGDKFVPFEAIDWREDHAVTRFDKDLIGDAPGPGFDGKLSDEEEFELYEHYGMRKSESVRGDGRRAQAAGPAAPAAESTRPAAESTRTRPGGDERATHDHRPTESRPLGYFDESRPERHRAESRGREPFQAAAEDYRESTEPAARHPHQDGQRDRSSERRRTSIEDVKAAHPFSYGLEEEERAGRPPAGSRPHGDKTSMEDVKAAHPFSYGLEEEEGRRGPESLGPESRDESRRPSQYEGEEVPGSSRLVRVKKFLATERSDDRRAEDERDEHRRAA
jgi:sporulation protein YlmC with PRC-barrel domain